MQPPGQGRTQTGAALELNVEHKAVIKITILSAEVAKPSIVSTGNAQLLVTIVTGCNFSCVSTRTARREGE